MSQWLDSGSNSDSCETTVEMFGDDEMELIVRRETQRWLAENAKAIFQEEVEKVVHVPSRKRLKASPTIKATTNSSNLNNVNTNK